MKVIIAQPGTYNDDMGRPVRCAKGDVLITAAGYGQTLLDGGFARPVLAQPPAATEPEQEPKRAPKPRATRKKAAK
jgi:hypothetical protein